MCSELRYKVDRLKEIVRKSTSAEADIEEWKQDMNESVACEARQAITRYTLAKLLRESPDMVTAVSKLRLADSFEFKVGDVDVELRISGIYDDDRGFPF
jgi:hypothetical protein